MSGLVEPSAGVASPGLASALEATGAPLQLLNACAAASISSISCPPHMVQLLPPFDMSWARSSKCHVVVRFHESVEAPRASRGRRERRLCYVGLGER